MEKSEWTAYRIVLIQLTDTLLEALLKQEKEEVDILMKEIKEEFDGHCEDNPL